MARLNSEVETALSSNADEFLLTFTKVQGLGNDFVVLPEDQLNGWLEKVYPASAPPSLSRIAAKLCDRNYGIGADGLILIRNSSTCDIGWIYLNSDGSTALMCGNGLRCLAHWCVSEGIVQKKDFTVETGKGPVQISYRSPKEITTDLGPPFLESRAIPLAVPDTSPVISYPVQLNDRTVKVTCVGMGNPHCVLFDSHIEEKDFGTVATSLQQHQLFPQGVNVSFVKSYTTDSADVVVWERGCGLTLACASAAAAVLVAGVLETKLKRSATINLPGGPLTIEWRSSDSHVHITGPASISFKGQIGKLILEAAP